MGLDTRARIVKSTLSAVKSEYAKQRASNEHIALELMPASCDCRFCISSSNEPFAEALNYASVDAPHGVSEFAVTGLTPVKGRLVNAPRIGEAPVSFELTVHSITEFNTDEGERGGCMVIGRVRLMHIRQDVIEADGAIDPAKTYPVSRFGGLLYGRSTRGL